MFFDKMDKSKNHKNTKQQKENQHERVNILGTVTKRPSVLAATNSLRLWHWFEDGQTREQSPEVPQ